MYPKFLRQMDVASQVCWWSVVAACGGIGVCAGLHHSAATIVAANVLFVCFVVFLCFFRRDLKQRTQAAAESAPKAEDKPEANLTLYLTGEPEVVQKT